MPEIHPLPGTPPSPPTGGQVTHLDAASPPRRIDSAQRTSGEPLHVTALFENDAAAAARQTILDRTNAAASSGMHRHGPLAYARAALASELLRERAKDVEVQLAAGESADRQMELVATVPAADAGDVAIKLAAAVRQMINIETAAEGPDTAEARAAEVQAVIADFFTYFNTITESRRANPVGDVASVIANATIDGQPISAFDAISYYVIIATAGHDTTSSSTAASTPSCSAKSTTRRRRRARSSARRRSRRRSRSARRWRSSAR